MSLGKRDKTALFEPATVWGLQAVRRKTLALPEVPAAAAAPEISNKVAKVDFKDVSATQNSTHRKLHKQTTWRGLKNTTPYFGADVNKVLGNERLRTIMNINAPGQTLSVGTGAILQHQTYAAMMSGGTDNSERHALVPAIITEQQVRLPELPANQLEGKSMQDLFGPCSQVLTGLTVDGISAIQWRLLMKSHSTPVRILVPSATDPTSDLWTAKLLHSATAHIRANVAAAKETKLREAKELYVVSPNGASFTEALAAQLGAGDDGRSVLDLSTIDWMCPTAVHYPDAPVQTCADIVLSDVGKRFKAIVVSHRATWLDEMGIAVRKRIAQHWDVYVQLRSKFVPFAPDSDYAKLLAENEKVIALIDGGKATADEIDLALQSLGDATLICGAKKAKVIADKANKRYKGVVSSTPTQRRLGLFSLGAQAARGVAGTHVCVLVRKRPAAAAAAAAAAL
jgi:hypothetical protein